MREGHHCVATVAGVGQNGQPAGWVSWLQLGLSGLLLVVAVQQRQRDLHLMRMRTCPRWMGALAMAQLRSGEWLDCLLSTGAISLLATPNFRLAILLIVVFAA